jgi:hypothetical protein
MCGSYDDAFGPTQTVTQIVTRAQPMSPAQARSFLSRATRKTRGLSQTARLALHFARGESISPVEAAAVYGVQRLAARVLELRKLGAAIGTELRVDSSGHRYARYLPGASLANEEGLRSLALYLSGGRVELWAPTDRANEEGKTL